MSYSILIEQSAQKDVQAIGTKRERRRIVDRILALASDPRTAGCEKLAGSSYHRVRQGAYRIVCEIQDRVLIVHVEDPLMREIRYLDKLIDELTRGKAMQ